MSTHFFSGDFEEPVQIAIAGSIREILSVELHFQRLVVMGSLDGDLKFEERAVMEHSSRIADDLEAFFPQGWFPAECIDQDVRIKKSSDYVSYYAPPRANESLLLICFWLSGFTPIAAALSLSS